MVVIGFCTLFLVLGIWRHQQTELKITNSELSKFNDLEEKIILVGVVSAEPDIKEKTIKLTIETESLNDGKTKGKILVTTYRYPEYKYGDKLKITGELKTPSENIEGFNYKNYLSKRRSLFGYGLAKN